MAKPILLSVDDDSDVLRAIERDLRSQYGAEYRVIGSDSPEDALDLLKQLKVRNDSVALLLADQRMPRMDGVEFLQQAMGIFPSAKRALLTAYADTNAAISAINQANINYFFLKPWDPPTEHLYPQLDDLLDDWQASFRPAFRGDPVAGHAVVTPFVRVAGLPGAQPRPLSVDRRRGFPPMIQKPNAFWKLLVQRQPISQWCFSPTGQDFSRVYPRTSRKKSGCAHARKPASMILPSWVEDRRVWPLPFMEPPKVCTQ